MFLRMLCLMLCLCALGNAAQAGGAALQPLETDGCGLRVFDVSDKARVLAFANVDDEKPQLKIDLGKGPMLLSLQSPSEKDQDFSVTGKQYKEVYKAANISVRLNAISTLQCCGIEPKEDCECSTLKGSMLLKTKTDSQTYRVEIHRGC